MNHTLGMTSQGISLVLCHLILAVVASASDANSEPPNIIFFLVDDLGQRDVGCYGSRFYETPAIDQLATEGVVFLNQYVSSPVCTPSRYSVLTGTYASRSSTFAKAAQRGEQVNITWNSHIDESTPNIARTLQKAGYFTGAVGKNHVITGDIVGGFIAGHGRHHDAVGQLQFAQFEGPKQNVGVVHG